MPALMLTWARDLDAGTSDYAMSRRREDARERSARRELAEPKVGGLGLPATLRRSSIEILPEICLMFHQTGAWHFTPESPHHLSKLRVEVLS